MSSPEAEWWQVHAGEYVLGTLDVKERELFERIVRHDPDLQRVVGDWEHRFSPLLARVPALEPPARVWEAIERRVRDADRGRDGDDACADGATAVARANGAASTSTEATTAATTVAEATPVPASFPDLALVDTPSNDAPSSDVSPAVRTAANGPSSAPSGTRPAERPARRRGGLLASAVAGLATAASLILGALLHEQGKRLDAIEGSILQADGVSVILGEDGAPLWLVQADFAGERVRVTALADPPAGGGGDYQLWQVLPDGGGVAAVSLLPDTDGTSEVAVVPGLASRFDAFAVSLEPDGGSPEPAPTGTVLYQSGVVYTDGEAR